jgi:uncharacterized hydrophobic protein (TIGR00341 family)
MEKKNENQLFSGLTQKEKDEAIEKIIDFSCPKKSFFLMTTISSILCTIGIMSNNASVIIGAMLVAPLLSPILAIALGISLADYRLIFRSIKVVAKASLYAVGFSFLAAFLLDKPTELNHEMLLRSFISLEMVIVALLAGTAASLSIIKKDLQQYLAGTAIAVALIPPLSMSAVALRMLEIQIFYNAAMIFLFNLVGIILSSLMVFSLSKFYTSQKKVTEELKEEETILEDNTINK